MIEAHGANATDGRVHEGARRLHCVRRGTAWRYTQGATIEEARANLEEAVTLVLDANRELSEQSLVGADVIRETLIVPAA
jgi:hypothetical protein